MIPYGRQHITQADVDAVTRVLRSDFLTQGPVVPRFEAAAEEGFGASHAVAVNSATSALHVACLALGLGEGATLWTSANTYVASANCARYCGANVDFVDIDPQTWNMSVDSLEGKLREARKTGSLPSVVVPVHFAGQPTEQERIWELAQEYSFRVVEDASHSIGASRSGEPVGSCRWSDITVFSFHPVKLITSAEGGMALTNDPELACRMQMFRSHGVTREAAQLTAWRPTADESESPPGWYYEQQLLGFNYRMTDLHAALGLSQLQRLQEYIEKRNSLARRYASELSRLPLRLPTISPENYSAFHLYVVRLEGRAAAEHRRVFDSLRDAGVGVNLHYMPVHLQPYYRKLGFKPGDCPEAEAHGREAISLPLFPTLSESDQQEVIAALNVALGSGS